MPKVSKKIDQATLTQDELNEVIKILMNYNISADYKVILISQIVLPAGSYHEG